MCSVSPGTHDPPSAYRLLAGIRTKDPVHPGDLRSAVLRRRSGIPSLDHAIGRPRMPADAGRSDFGSGRRGFESLRAGQSPASCKLLRAAMDLVYTEPD